MPHPLLVLKYLTHRLQIHWISRYHTSYLTYEPGSPVGVFVSRGPARPGESQEKNTRQTGRAGRQRERKTKQKTGNKTLCTFQGWRDQGPRDQKGTKSCTETSGGVVLVEAAITPSALIFTLPSLDVCCSQSRSRYHHEESSASHTCAFSGKRDVHRKVLADAGLHPFYTMPLCKTPVRSHPWFET
jgi:hypothetical protein